METNESINIIKKILSDFIESTMKSNKEVDIGKGDKVNLNYAIYEIQHHFNDELKRREINIRLNDKIYSKNILDSFKLDLKPHKAEEYCFRFLKFLHNNYLPDYELYEYIDSFVDEIQGQLTWQDLVITSTGITRCKTNIKGALTPLRALGLVRKKNKMGKWSYQPTVLGQLILIYFDWMNEKYQPLTKLENDISIGGYNHLCSHFKSLSNPLTFPSFIEYLLEKYPMNEDNRLKVKGYLEQFTKIIVNNSIITDTGIIIPDELKKSNDYSTYFENLCNDYMIILPPRSTMPKKAQKTPGRYPHHTIYSSLFR